MTTAVQPSGIVTEEISVELDGVTYRNWKSVRIARELQSASGSFEFSASISHPWPAKTGADVRVFLGKSLAAVGFVDDLSVKLGADSHTISVVGRDKTADLVDCSVPPNLGQLSSFFLDEIATLIAEPYGVELEVLETGPIFPTYVANQGDSAWTAIERACRLRGKLAHVTPTGKLRIGRVGQTRADGSIREGEAELELRWTNADRFRFYTVHGQGKGSDDGWGDSVAAVRAESRDSGIVRPRRLVVIAESAVDTATAQERADWERTVRIARSASITATVRGWRQKFGGRLWELNELVSVSVPRWRFAAELLVDGLEFTRDESGTKTTLRLVRPSSYLREPDTTKPDPFDTWADDGRSTTPDDVEEDL